MIPRLASYTNLWRLKELLRQQHWLHVLACPKEMQLGEEEEEFREGSN